MENVKSTQSFTGSGPQIQIQDSNINLFQFPGYNIFIRNLAIWNLELNDTEVEEVYDNEGWF